MGETQFKVGDVVKLTGEGWKELGLLGKTVKIEVVDKSGDPYFFGEDDGERLYIYNVGGKNDFSAMLVEEAAPVETRKKLREYTDLEEGDVVVIAGVEMRVYMYARGYMRLAQARGGSVEADGPLLDMLVDEVRRAKRAVKEIVIREDASGPIFVNGVRFRKVAEREVEE